MPGRGRESYATGTLKIRQVYIRTGHSICALTIPAAVLKHLGWKPNTLMTYYPTVAGELVIVPHGQVLAHVSPDYDRRGEPEADEIRGPRPGSIAARELEVDDHMQELHERVARANKGARVGKGRSDGRADFVDQAMEKLDQAIDVSEERARAQKQQQRAERDQARDQARGPSPARARAAATLAAHRKK
jgi:hypothetical protein